VLLSGSGGDILHLALIASAGSLRSVRGFGSLRVGLDGFGWGRRHASCTVIDGDDLAVNELVAGLLEDGGETSRAAKCGQQVLSEH
jgi:hypothetical protein